MPEEKEPIPKFAARIKAKYPEYKDMNDTLLTQKILAKYPEYSDMVDMSGITNPAIKKKEGLGVFGATAKTSTNVSSPTTSKLPSEIEEKINLTNAITQVPFKKNERPFDETKEDAIAGVKGKLQELSLDADPIGLSEKQSSKLYTNNLKEAVHYEAAKSYVKEELNTIQGARNWVYKEGKQFDENNKTDLAARNKINEYEKVKSLIEIHNGDFEKAAIDLAAEKNPDVRSAKENLPREVVGELVNEFLFNPNVQELKEENQAVNQAYYENKANIRQNYPQQWTNNIVKMIAQGREDYGENNPFINLVGVNSADRVIQKLYEDKKVDDWDIEHYKEVVRPLLAVNAKEVPTTGLLETTFQSAVKGMQDIPKGVYDLTGVHNLITSEGDMAYDRLSEDANMVGVTPKSFATKLSSTTGHLAGVLLPMGLSGKALTAAKIIRNPATASQVMMGLTFYHDLYKEAERQNPDGGYSNQLQALVQSVIFAKINPTLGAMSKGLVREATPEIKNILNQLKTESITGSEAKTSIVKSILSKLPQATKHSLKASGEMTLATGLSDAVGGVFSGKFDADQTAQNMASTFESMMFGTPLINLLITPGARKNVGRTMYELTSDPASRARLESATKDNPQLQKEILENFDHATEVRKLLDEREDLKPGQKEKFMVAEVQQKVLENKIEKSPSKALNLKEEKEIAALEIEKQMIVDPDMGNRKFVEEMYKEDLLPKGVMESLEVEGKFNPQKVGGVLKEIAQQANNLDVNWQPNSKELKHTKPNVPEQLIEVANERWAKEIEAAQPKETPPQERELDMGGEKMPTKKEFQEAEKNPITSKEDAETRLSNGDRIFAFHEMDEGGIPIEIKNVGDLNNQAYDLMVAVPRKESPFAPQPQVSSVSEKSFPLVGENVDGRKVRDKVPNMGSIEATFNEGEYEVLSGIREMPMSEFELGGTVPKRGKELATEINESGELNPLIVVIEKNGAYILEGANRFDALREIGAKSFPAKIVIDTKSFEEIAKPESKQPTNEAPTQEGGKGENLEVSGKGVTSPRYGKAENIPGQKDKGTSNSPRLSSEESPEKLNERYKRVVGETDFVDPYDLAVKYFADGGKINPSELERIFGGKGDKGARISLMKNKAGTVKKIAHYLWESVDETGKYEDTHFIDAIESALRDFPSQSAMKKDLADRYDLEGAYEKYLTQTHGKEAIEITERMSEEEMNHWLKLDAENSPERDKFIDERLKNETTQSDTKKVEPISPIESGGEKELVTEATPPTGGGEGTGKATEGEWEVGGITHAANEIRRKERGLPEYQKNPTTEEALMNEAEKKLQEGYDVEDLMNRLEKGATPEPVENFIRKIYVATLDAEISKNPTDALLAKQKRFAVVGDLVNSKLGLNLWSLKGEASPLSSISDFYVSAMEAKGTDKLTEAEKLEVQKDYAEVKAARDKAEKVAQDATAKFEEMKAENELLKQQLAAKNKSKSAKVYTTDGKRDFKSEIKNYKDELIAAKKEHEQWLKDSGIHTAGVSFSLTPKMAKIILKIAATHVEQVGVKIAEVAKRTWEDVKDIFDGIVEKDIMDVFSGKYDEKKLTRSEIFAQMRELKTESKLLIEYENLLKGGEPKEETKKQKRNQRLADIRKQIDELNKERGTGKYSDEAIAKRAIDANKRKKAEFDRKLKEGEFEKEKQPVSIYDSPQFKKKNTKLYNELLDSQNEAHDSQLRFEKKLMEEEMKKWGLGDKLRNIVKKFSGTLKTLFASFDASAIGIQNLPMIIANPVMGVKGVVHSYKGFLKQKAFDRYLGEIHNSPDWPMIKESIRITEPKSLLESGREEFFPNRFKAVVTIKGKQYGWIKVGKGKYELLDISKPFERQFTMLGNILRVTKFRTEATKLYEKGLTWEKNREEFITLGKRIDNLTSSPDVPAAYQNDVTRTFIWSTRLLAAKLNMLGISDVAAMIPGTGVTKGYYKGLGIKGQLISRQQFAAVGDLAKFAVGVVSATYIYALARGWTVNTDPDDNGFMDATSPDGTESMNFTGGFSRPISLIFQMAEGGKRKKGVFKKYGGFTDPVKELSRFVAGKAPPLTRTTLNIVAGKDMAGKPADIETEAAKYKMPLAVGQIYKQIERDGLDDLFKQGMLMYIGINSKDTRDYEKEGDVLTPEDLKDPTFKEFSEKGINFPEFNPEKIQTKEVNGKVVEHLSDYPKEVQEKYIATKKKYFKEELKNLQTGEYQVYRDKNGTVHIESENVETGEMKFVPFKSLTPEDIQYLIGSVLSGRATKRAKEDGILDKPPLKKQN